MARGFAIALVWAALVGPHEVARLTWLAFVRLPLEALILVALAWFLPERVTRWLAIPVGLFLALVLVLKLVDLGFSAALDRPFDPVADWGYFGPGVGVLGDSIGRGPAIAVAIGLAILAVGIVVAMPWAVRRLAGLVGGRGVGTTLLVLGIAWIVLAVSGVTLIKDTPVASVDAVDLTVDRVQEGRVNLADRQVFANEIQTDPLREGPLGADPGENLLARLKGKHVLLVFVESYGRGAVQDSTYAPGVIKVLDDGTTRLVDAGASARSAFLTSPTFGAASWLAHSSLQSGLWVSSQRRYDQLITEDRFTLTHAFDQAGWRTVFDVPANDHDWPEGQAYYGFEQLYDARNVGYRGPEFGYASMPDQYTLEHFRRAELMRTDAPSVMAEIDLISSHAPWAPLPTMIDWEAVGDGSVFEGMPEQEDSRDEVWSDPASVRAAYGQSIEYTLTSIISFVETYPRDDLVLIVLGDHQPATIVSGESASRDVPISIISSDSDVLSAIDDWDWQEGLRPKPDATVWRMDEFRDRFLTAYSS
jgi:hypothetical protein